MIKVENIETFNWQGAIRGMRNPLNSWDKSDSYYCLQNEDLECDDCILNSLNCGICDNYIIGENDLKLIKKLYKAGSEHRKYLRQIFVSMDITAPLYWWKEFDTYKIGTVANSCSTMHTIADKEFILDDFSCEHLMDNGVHCYPLGGGWRGLNPTDMLRATIELLNNTRRMYLETKDKKYWWQMIQLLPTSYNQKRTVTMNYENVISMIKQRENHKLDEWNEFVKILKELPYIKEITEND